jgi:hypothetical protein
MTVTVESPNQWTLKDRSAGIQTRCYASSDNGPIELVRLLRKIRPDKLTRQWLDDLSRWTDFETGQPKYSILLTVDECELALQNGAVLSRGYHKVYLDAVGLDLLKQYARVYAIHKEYVLDNPLARKRFYERGQISFVPFIEEMTDDHHHWFETVFRPAETEYNSYEAKVREMSEGNIASNNNLIAYVTVTKDDGYWQTVYAFMRGAVTYEDISLQKTN